MYREVVGRLNEELVLVCGHRALVAAILEGQERTNAEEILATLDTDEPMYVAVHCERCSEAD